MAVTPFNSTLTPTQSTVRSVSSSKLTKTKAPGIESTMDAPSSHNAAAEIPLNMLYQTAIVKLNEQLAPFLGSDVIQPQLNLEVNVSPSATADRIVALTTDVYNAFKAQHGEKDEAYVLDIFMDTINKGLEQGFAEVRQSLEQLSVLQGKIANDLDRTYEWVQLSLANFFQVQQET